MSHVLLFLIGLLAGRVACLIACWCLRDETTAVPATLGVIRCRACQQDLIRRRLWRSLFQPRPRCGACGRSGPAWPFVVSLTSGAFFAWFAWLLVEQGCQRVPEVQPAHSMAVDRLPFQATFLFLMLIVTVTDVLDYAIPELFIWLGVAIAVVASTISGDLQIIHIWVNWDHLETEIHGPYLPEWMKVHRHLHGLAWPVAGMLTGAGLMWAIRILAGAVLGVAAVGFGDVLLMLMIGAFMGWQPTLCVLAIAPLAGFILGMVSRICLGRTFVAFGPYLTFSAVVVLCAWRLLWDTMNLKIIFSHWPTIAGLVGGTLLLLTVLLGLLRLIRTIPAETLKR